jgi:Gluconate 2-dehydrogenase subunit 3
MKHAEPNNSRSKEQQTGERALANEQSVATNGRPWRLTRRRLLARAATGVASAVRLPRVIAKGATATPTAPSAVTTPAGLEFFTPWEASAVQADAVRLIPTTQNGPGATEAGDVYFIDRQLNSPWSLYLRRCNRGSFAPGESTQVECGSLNLRERYRLGLLALDNYVQVTFKASFVALTPRGTRATTRPGPWMSSRAGPPTRSSPSTCRVTACWRR